MSKRFWRPLLPSPAEHSQLSALAEEHTARPAQLDLAACKQAEDLLALAMQDHVEKILERDGAPHTCHIINGWGNGQIHGRPMVDQLLRFVQRDASGNPMMLQRHPEGDGHPWQSLAYAVMAGVDVDTPLGDTDVTLRRIAQNSRSLLTPDGEELGHLLYALSHLDPHDEDGPFEMDGQRCDTDMLIERAIHAHHHGHFKVCRKFHLTEGLCAAAGMPGREGLRETAEGFLEGQLEIAGMLCMILREIDVHLAAGTSPSPDSLLSKRILQIHSYVENHYYYAGHLVELAALVEDMGFQISPMRWSQMYEILNRLNRRLPRFIQRISFSDYYLHFGHYRRAISLARQRASGVPYDRAAFAVDFSPRSEESLPQPASIGFLKVAPPSDPPRPGFQVVLDAYSAVAQADLQPRGGFAHFRRVHPPDWPRALHYELLDYGERIGAEIHLESNSVLTAQAPLKALGAEVARRFPSKQVMWDPDWSFERGRLLLLLDPTLSPAQNAETFREFIAYTLPTIDPIAKALPSL